MSELGKLAKIIDLALENYIQVAYDNRILGEYEDLMARPELRIRRILPPTDIIEAMDSSLLSKLKVDRSALSVSTLTDESDEKAYWLRCTPYERLKQVEILRRINYGHRATARLQRVLEIIERK